MRIIFYIIVLFIFGQSMVLAKDVETQDYYKAYNICSPFAHNVTKQQCNYARVFEQYYTACMTQKGFRSEDDTADPGYYEQYMKSYKECSIIADNYTIKNCNYGVLYQKSYNGCMLRYGFNAQGEKTTPQNDDTDDQNGFKFNF